MAEAKAKQRVAPPTEKNSTTPPKKELKPGVVAGEDVKVRILKATSKNRKGHVVTMDKHAADQMIARGIAEVWVDDELNLKNAIKFVYEHSGEIVVADPESAKGVALVEALSELEVGPGEFLQALKAAEDKVKELEDQLKEANDQIAELTKPAKGKSQNAGNKS